jgi:hypothetical protein
MARLLIEAVVIGGIPAARACCAVATRVSDSSLLVITELSPGERLARLKVENQDGTSQVIHPMYTLASFLAVYM